MWMNNGIPRISVQKNSTFVGCGMQTLALLNSCCPYLTIYRSIFFHIARLVTFNDHLYA